MIKIQRAVFQKNMKWMEKYFEEERKITTKGERNKKGEDEREKKKDKK